MLPTSGDAGDRFKKGVEPGTVTWRQGKKWVAVPPPYDRQYYLDHPLPGTYKYSIGKGSAYRTLQVLNGLPPEDVDIDMGWAQIHISSKDGTLSMNYAGGKEAAEDRWAEEKARMGEAERLSYAEAPIGEVREKIPFGFGFEKEPEPITVGAREEFAPVRLDKVELPQYNIGDVKVYMVNGEYVRSELSKEFPDAVNFTQGAHDLVADYIPTNEIWVDNSLDTPEDRKATLLHELREYRAMKKGMGYQEAHESVANPIEREARHNPEEMDDLLLGELEQHEPRPKRKINNRQEVEEEELKIPIIRSRKVRQKEENEEIQLPHRYYLGHKLRPAVIGVRL